MNKLQKLITATSAILLGLLLLFPPWQQAASRELDYRKDIGHGFILRRPDPVSVECYFAGCETAPSSYFHVQLYSELLIAQCTTVLCISLAVLWIFRTRRNGVPTSIKSLKTRIVISILVALAIPPLGQFPLATMLFDIPK